MQAVNSHLPTLWKLSKLCRETGLAAAADIDDSVTTSGRGTEMNCNYYGQEHRQTINQNMKERNWSCKIRNVTSGVTGESDVSAAFCFVSGVISGDFWRTIMHLGSALLQMWHAKYPAAAADDHFIIDLPAKYFFSPDMWNAHKSFITSQNN